MSYLEEQDDIDEIEYDFLRFVNDFFYYLPLIEKYDIKVDAMEYKKLYSNIIDQWKYASESLIEIMQNYKATLLLSNIPEVREKAILLAKRFNL